MERTNGQRSGDVGISRLYGIAALNIQRLVHRFPDVAWDTMTSHLIFVLRYPVAPQPICLKAARTLNDILVIIPRHRPAAPSDLQPAVQRRILNVLAQQIMLSTASSTDMDLRRLDLETLHRSLQASDQTIPFLAFAFACFRPKLPTSVTNSQILVVICLPGLNPVQLCPHRCQRPHHLRPRLLGRQCSHVVSWAHPADRRYAHCVIQLETLMHGRSIQYEYDELASLLTTVSRSPRFLGNGAKHTFFLSSAGVKSAVQSLVRCPGRIAVVFFRRIFNRSPGLLVRMRLCTDRTKTKRRGVSVLLQ